MKEKLVSIEEMAQSLPRLPASGIKRLTALRAAFANRPAPAALGVRPNRAGYHLAPLEVRIAEVEAIAATRPEPVKTRVQALPPLSEEEARGIPTEALYFDRDWYVRTYPDVAQSGIDPATHFRECGDREGRNPNPHFNSRLYLAANPDVAHADLGPFEHFIMYGIEERRRLRPD
ncbi:hypothetical protein [Acetobacter oeni]|uniref:hypothetical protein n=1 Tax=Acetobacter oeni TaxID=304077 RepID=UPI0017B8482C|nr:hypothetical protein [Acetobacter oeni]MBB3881312.1 hypothetical protein [Acetobacter oeni]